MAVIPCTKNPIVEYIKYVIQQYELDPALYSNSLYSAFNSFTSHTFISDTNTEYCCPSCGTYGFTLIASLAEVFINAQGSKNEGCCLNYNGTNIKFDRFMPMVLAGEEFDYQNCCNNFQSCSEDLLKLIQSKFCTPDGETLYDLSIGIYEISLLSGKTVTCELYQYLTTPSLSNDYIYDIIRFIRNFGLMVSCNIGEGENVFETTVNVID